jgi:beta-lactamase superfamily II metal-dependent hydrolase
VKLEIFDVEHGACALLSSDDGKHLMLDCGHNATTGWLPGKHLNGLGVSVLDVLMVTNYDEDHVSGFKDLDTRVHIGVLYRNKSVSPDTIRHLKSDTGIGPGMDHFVKQISTYQDLTGPAPTLPKVSWKLFRNPYPQFDDENNLSLVVCLNVDGINFVFPGDMECAGWEKLLSANADLAAQIALTDVLVASHHGRESGICDDMFVRYGCKPILTVISDDCHKYDTQQTVNYYGSKSRGTLFRGSQRRVLSTRNDGQITFEFYANNCIAY